MPRSKHQRYFGKIVDYSIVRKSPAGRVDKVEVTEEYRSKPQKPRCCPGHGRRVEEKAKCTTQASSGAGGGSADGTMKNVTKEVEQTESGKHVPEEPATLNIMSDVKGESTLEGNESGIKRGGRRAQLLSGAFDRRS